MCWMVWCAREWEGKRGGETKREREKEREEHVEVKSIDYDHILFLTQFEMS